MDVECVALSSEASDPIQASSDQSHPHPRAFFVEVHLAWRAPISGRQGGMDELKEKLKGVKLKSLFSKKAPAFKGTGHVLGSGPGPSGSAGAASGRAAAPQPSLAAAQRSALPPQRQPVPPAAGAGRPVQHAPLPAAPVTTGPSPAAPSPLPPPSAAPVAAAPAAPGASSPAADEPEPVLPPSPGAQEAVEAAVAQLASDGPHAAAAAAVLSRLLRNVLASPADPKFRRLRLSNPRVQARGAGGAGQGGAGRGGTACAKAAARGGPAPPLFWVRQVKLSAPQRSRTLQSLAENPPPPCRRRRWWKPPAAWSCCRPAGSMWWSRSRRAGREARRRGERARLASRGGS